MRTTVRLGARAVLRVPGDGEALAGIELDGAVFEVDQEAALDDEEELVLAVVLVPVELAVQDAEADDAIVHPAERLVVPGFFAGVGEGLHVDELERGELGTEVDRIRGLRVHVGLRAGPLAGGLLPGDRRHRRPRGRGPLLAAAGGCWAFDFHFADAVDYRAVDPLDRRDDLFAELRRGGRAAAHLVDLRLDLLDRADRELGAVVLEGLHEVFAARVDGDAALGDDHVDQLAGPAERRHLVHDDRDAVADGRDRAGSRTGWRGSSASRRCRAAAGRRSA